MKTATQANIYLIIITAIWGLTFPLIRSAISQIDPYSFVCLRFGFAALFFLPLVLKQLSRTNKKLLLGGALLGLLNSAAYTAQTLGLQTVHSGRGAFITGFSVALVPFLLPFFKLGKPKPLEIASSLVCLLGLYVLTGADIDHITRGDIWIFIGAVFFALSIASVHYVTRFIKEYRLLTFYQILFTVPLALLCSPEFSLAPLLYPAVLTGILTCAIFATSLALFIQMKFQPLTTAPKAALIYALEPFFACVFGFLINKEAITPPIALGGAIILASLLLPELKGLIRPE